MSIIRNTKIVDGKILYSCSICGEYKPLNEFHKKGERVRSDCKVCRNLKAKRERPRRKNLRMPKKKTTKAKESGKTD